MSIGNIRVSVFMEYILKSSFRTCRDKWGKFGPHTNISGLLFKEDGVSRQLLRVEFLYQKNRFRIREATGFLEKREQLRARDYCEIAGTKVRASWSKDKKRELSEPVNESASKGILPLKHRHGFERGSRGSHCGLGDEFALLLG
jgi:hypothetical protein